MRLRTQEDWLAQSNSPRQLAFAIGQEFSKASASSGDGAAAFGVDPSRTAAENTAAICALASTPGHWRIASGGSIQLSADVFIASNVTVEVCAGTVIDSTLFKFSSANTSAVILTGDGKIICAAATAPSFTNVDGLTVDVRIEDVYGDPVLPIITTSALRIAELEKSSFIVSTAYRIWQGVCYGNGRIYGATDRNTSFTLENILTEYDLHGGLTDTLEAAYTGTDPGAAFMSFGSPTYHNGYIYIPVYNYNSGGSPLISRVARFTVNPLALDTSFGTAGAVSIGSYTAEQVVWRYDRWFVCYHDRDEIRTFDSGWNSLATYSLSEAAPANGGGQAMLWEGTTMYLVCHGPNDYSAERSVLHRYTWTGSGFTYVSAHYMPSIGSGSGSSPAPFGYVWGDRPANAVVFTKNILPSFNALKPGTPDVNLTYTPVLKTGGSATGWTLSQAIGQYTRQSNGAIIAVGRITVSGKSGTTSGTATITLPAIAKNPGANCMPGSVFYASLVNGSLDGASATGIGCFAAAGVAAMTLTIDVPTSESSVGALTDAYIGVGTVIGFSISYMGEPD